MITDKEIKELKRLEREATEGPWKPVSDLPTFSVWSDALKGDVISSESRRYCAPYKRHHGTRERDAKLIAASRNALPALLARLKSAEEALEFYGYYNTWDQHRMLVGGEDLRTDLEETPFSRFTPGARARAHFAKVRGEKE